MGTMLLGGLWHGASWTFVVWGGLHGLYLSIERFLRSRYARYAPGPAMLFAFGVLTYLLINITWVFFRAKDFSKAWSVLRGMAGANAGTTPILDTFSLLSVALIVTGIVGTHWLMRRRTLESVLAARSPALIAAAWGFMAFCVVIAQGKGNAFIYFQF